MESQIAGFPFILLPLEKSDHLSSDFISPVVENINSLFEAGSTRKMIATFSVIVTHFDVLFLSQIDTII